MILFSYFRTPSAVMEEYTSIFLHGIIGKYSEISLTYILLNVYFSSLYLPTYTTIFILKGQRTWREDLRGRARDHTLGNPLLPPVQQNDPPTNLTTHEAILLQYFPIRDDFEVITNKY